MDKSRSKTRGNLNENQSNGFNNKQSRSGSRGTNNGQSNNSNKNQSRSGSRGSNENQRPSGHRMGRGRGSGTQEQVDAARRNPWLEHVAEVRESREAKGLSQPEIVQLARESYRPIKK